MAKIGRPKKTLKDLTKNWEKLIINLMSEGASIVEVSQELKITRDLLYRFIKDYPEFSDTIKRGKEASEAWWTRTGRRNLENPKFSYTGWYMNMKNRFGWKDKQEVEHNGEVLGVIMYPPKKKAGAK